MGKEIKKETDWLGREKWSIYDNNEKIGETKKETDWLGREKQVTYSINGEKVSETKRESDWLGREKFITYDPDGKKCSETKYEYDWLGRPKECIYEDGKKVGELIREKSIIDEVLNIDKKKLHEFNGRDIDLTRRVEKSISSKDNNNHYGSSNDFNNKYYSSHGKDNSFGLIKLILVLMCLGILILFISQYLFIFYTNESKHIPQKINVPSTAIQTITLAPSLSIKPTDEIPDYKRVWVKISRDPTTRIISIDFEGAQNIGIVSKMEVYVTTPSGMTYSKQTSIKSGPATIKINDLEDRDHIIVYMNFADNTRYKIKDEIVPLHKYN